MMEYGENTVAYSSAVLSRKYGDSLLGSLAGYDSLADAFPHDRSMEGDTEKDLKSQNGDDPIKGHEAGGDEDREVGKKDRGKGEKEGEEEGLELECLSEEMQTKSQSNSTKTKVIVKSGACPARRHVPVICKVCQEAFRDVMKLRNHVMDLHQDTYKSFYREVNRFSCTLCGKSFQYATDLKNHLHVHTGEKPYQCPLCDKSYSYNGDLTKHMRIHTGELPFLCTHCGKAFPTSSDLTKHTRTHTGDKPFMCNICNREFANAAALASHVKTHSGVKDYGCKECGMRFGRHTHLVRHLKTHSGDKPHKCSICGKDFASPNYLDIHRRIHSGERPYKCDKCSKDFTDPGAWRRHLQTHSSEKKFQCEYCGKYLSRRDKVTRHQKICKMRPGAGMLAFPGTEEQFSLANPGFLPNMAAQIQHYDEVLRAEEEMRDSPVLIDDDDSITEPPSDMQVIQEAYGRMSNHRESETPLVEINATSELASDIQAMAAGYIYN